MATTDTEIREKLGITESMFYEELKLTTQAIADALLLQLDLLEKLSKQKEENEEAGGIVLRDRALPDCAGYGSVGLQNNGMVGGNTL